MTDLSVPLVRGPVESRPRLRSRLLVVEQGIGLWGAQRYLLRLAPLLAEAGFESVLAAPPDSPITAAWCEAGLPTAAFPTFAQRSIRRAGDSGPIDPRLVAREAARTLTEAYRIARLAGAVGAHLIVANSHWNHLSVALGARLARRPSVLHLHEGTLPGIAGHLRSIAVGLADLTIGVSDAVVADLPRRSRRHAVVISNGVDVGIFRPGPVDPAVRRELAADPDAPVVGVICRLDPRKGVDQVIRAMSLFAEPLSGAQLAVVGEGGLDPQWALHLRALGGELLGERVRFVGPRADIATVLHSVDALVLASSMEGMPLSVLEAQACGTPVVAYPTAGIPQLIEDGRTGLLADNGDVLHLSGQLARVLTDGPLRDVLIGQARERVLAEFTLAGQARRQVEALSQVLSRRAAQP